MNRFGPTSAAHRASVDRAFNQALSGGLFHIDTIVDMQARGVSVRDAVEVEQLIHDTVALHSTY